VTISATFNARLFMSESAFHSYSLNTVWLGNSLSEEYQRKRCSKNVDEIDHRFQFHQHFMRAFFVKIFEPKNYKAKM